VAAHATLGINFSGLQNWAMRTSSASLSKSELGCGSTYVWPQGTRYITKSNFNVQAGKTITFVFL
jgi:hypothetical protein